MFGGTDMNVVTPHPADVAGFTDYLSTYESGLEIQRQAVVSLPLTALPGASS